VTCGPLLMVLVDALRHDQVTKEMTPFLWGMAERGSQTAVEETCAPCESQGNRSAARSPWKRLVLLSGGDTH
jgi:hypothetical protein